jgi:hypothetical protein
MNDARAGCGPSDPFERPERIGCGHCRENG